MNQSSPQASPQSSPSSDSPPGLSSDAVYHDACETMRATDEISLRLLAAVPLVTGIGISLLVREPSEDFPAAARFLVGLFGAVVTFAIYRWERKNTMDCFRLRNSVIALEREYLQARPPVKEGSRLEKPPHRHGSSPRLLGCPWGKKEAERLLYWAVIVGWLVTGMYALAR